MSTKIVQMQDENENDEFPVTSTKAVYDDENNRLDNTLTAINDSLTTLYNPTDLGSINKNQVVSAYDRSEFGGNWALIDNRVLTESNGAVYPGFQAQIGMNIKTGRVYKRGQYNGTWGDWKELVDIDSLNGKPTIVPFTPTSGAITTSYGGCYYYVKNNRCRVHLGMQSLTANAGAYIYTMPSGLRPYSQVTFRGTGGGSTKDAVASAMTDGRIYVYTTDGFACIDIEYECFN